MEKDLKDILLKDLCSRLPYGVKVQIPDKYGGHTSVIKNIDIDGYVVDDEGALTEIEWARPYLFPLSSMTDEQIYQSPFGYATMDTIRQDDIWSTITIGCQEYDDIIDWLNKNHFDYRGLIPMGLAIDATGLNIY